MLADLALEWNELERAEDIARQALELSERWGNQDNLCATYLTLAEILIAQHALEAAQEAHDAAQELSCRATVLPTFPPCLRAVEGKLRLAEGNLTALRAWANKTRLPDPLTPIHADEAVMLARAHLALDALNTAAQMLTKTGEMAREHEMTTAQVEALALQALVSQRQGQTSQAQATLLDALALAEPQGYVRRFVAFGPEMAVLLQEINATQQPPQIAGYVKTLLVAAGERPDPTHTAVDLHRATERTRARGAGDRRRRTDKPRDGPAAFHRGEHCQIAPQSHLRQAGRQKSHRGRRQGA